MRLLGAVLAVALMLPAAAAAAPSPKLSTSLQDVAAGRTAPTAARGAVAAAPADLLEARGGYVVEIRTDGTGAALVDRLRAAGARIRLVSPRYGTVTAAVGATELDAVAGVAGVEAVNEVPVPDVGRVEVPQGATARRVPACPSGIVSEGDAQLKAAIAKATYGVDGTGVKVGILSDSFDTKKGTAAPPGTTAAQDIASGDLPGPGNPCGHTTPVTVLNDFTPAPGGTTGDEGRAMAQIVHDVAPGAELLYATAFGGETEFAANIVALKDAGADIIVDDVINRAEPMYQDGAIANAVTEVTDAGVAYFSMAFNNGQVDAADRDIGSWEASAFRSTDCPTAVSSGPNFPAGSTCMDFDPGADADPTFDIGTNVPGGNGTLNLVLNWANPRGAVDTDYDMWVLFNGTLVNTTGSRNVNATTQLPLEFITLTGGTLSVPRQIIISRRPSSAGNPRLQFVVHNNGARISSLEYPTGGGVDTVGPTIWGHNGTAAAQTVGAIAYDTTSAPEDFSGRGPVTHLFAPVPGTSALAAPEVLSKPDVTATNRGANSFFGYVDSGIRRFSGTSAAAPHAAGVAALQLQLAPGLTPAQVKANQKSSATAIGAFTPFQVGSGLVDALGAIKADPLVVTATGPAASGSDRQPATTFSANRSATFTCALDAAAAAACTSPFTPAAALGDGAHSLTITATDPGAVTATKAVAFTIVTPPPVVTATPTPTVTVAPTASPTPTPTVAPAAKQCAVPKLKGKTRKQAKKALKQANCRLGRVKGPKGGRVKSQSPKAGKTKSKGTKVAIKLKKKR